MGILYIGLVGIDAMQDVGTSIVELPLIISAQFFIEAIYNYQI
jgi:hypothetical protein